MAQHIYDENGNYRGKVLTEKEQRDSNNSTLGCLLYLFVFFIFVLPVYMVYFYVFSIRGKLRDAGVEETYWGSITISLMLLFESTKAEPQLVKAKVYSWIAAILAIVTTYYLLIMFNQ